MTFSHLLVVVLVALALVGGAAFGDPATTTAPAATTRPADAAAVGNGWDASAFAYPRQPSLVVEETTPTPAQVDWHHQPPKLAAGVAAPVATPGHVAPLAVSGLNVTRLRFRDLDNADVPVLLVTPRDRPGPFPVVIALHGLRSNKGQVVAQPAPALAKQGFAVLAPDLPLHGERPGDPTKMFDQKDFRAFVHRVDQAVLDVRLCIDVAETRPELDTTHGVILVGYSMGSIINSVVGPADPRVKAMCLMVGGTVDFPPFFAGVPQLVAIQPQLAIAHFAGRPLLMVNATGDHVITREMSDRLYAAAPDPKKQIWFDSGHLLPDKAYQQCAEWVAGTWRGIAGAPGEKR